MEKLTGGYSAEQKETSIENKTENNTESTSSQKTNVAIEKKVNISVLVDGKEVETRQNIDKNKTDLEIEISGKGTQMVTVNAGGDKTTKSIDFENATTVYIP